MTVQNPALYLQSENHPAEDFRHLITKVFGGREGVVDTDGLTVVEAGTPNMTVDVSEGTVLIDGTEATYQGLYLAHNRGATSLAISASDPTNDRYDLVVAQVEDSDYSGAVSGWKLAVVTGAAAATPLFPTVPDNAFVLATVLVGNGVSSIVDADITDIRSASDTDGTTTLGNTGFVSATGGTQVCTSTTRPSPVTGMEIYETDTGLKYIYDGTEWALIGGKPASMVKSVVGSSGTVTTDEMTMGTISLEPGTWIISGSVTSNANITQDTEIILSLYDAAPARRTFTAHKYDWDDTALMGRASLSFTFVYVNTSTQNWILSVRRTTAVGSVSFDDGHFVCQRIA